MEFGNVVFCGERKTGRQRMIKSTEALCSTRVRFDFEHASAWLLGGHILTCTVLRNIPFSGSSLSVSVCPSHLSQC